MRKTKLLGISVTVVCIAFCLTGCMEEETVPKTEDLASLTPMNGSSLELEDPVENDMKLVVSYDTGNYNLHNWRITDSKGIKISATLENIPEGAEILMEHSHIDISLKSTHPQLDGLSQDYMDNSYHGTSQDGFLISDIYPYECDFSIEGFSKDIIDGWGVVCGEYGTMSISEKRLTEKNLIEYGKVYANKVQVVYSLIIKYEGEEKYHKKDIRQEFIIPVSSLKEEAESE